MLSDRLQNSPQQQETPTYAAVSTSFDALLEEALRSVSASGSVTKLASFIGHITAIEAETAFVSAVNQDTGERFEAECDLSLLRGNGIDQSMEFLCTSVRKGRQTAVEFAPLPPKVLSDEDIRRVLDEVDSKLG